MVKKIPTYHLRPTTYKNLGRIGILMGGPSSEREVSLKSGKAVYDSLKGLRLDVVAIDIKSDGIEDNIHLIKPYKLDCAFLALHGRFGEDGQIQDILDTLKIPYTCSGSLASQLAMDKINSRVIFSVNNLPVPRYHVVNRISYHTDWKIHSTLDFPLVVKPATHGSSIGISFVHQRKDLSRAIDIAFSFDERVLIEDYIKGRELTGAVLDGRPLPLIEIVPKKDFFDYEAKYHYGMSEYVVPAKINKNITNRIQSFALSAHKLLGCHGCSRTDFILTKDMTPYLLEVNTIPGLTPTSLLPKAAKFLGIGFSELCLKLIKLAYEKAKK